MKKLFLTFVLCVFYHTFIYCENKPAVPGKLVDELKSDDFSRQNEAKRNLRSFHFKEVAKAMKDFAKDPNPDMRILMAQTLGELGGFEAGKNLKILFKKEKDDRVRRAILIQLSGLLPDENDALSFFKDVAIGDPNDDIRFLALTQLSILGQSPALKKQLLKICKKAWKKELYEQNKIYAAVMLIELGEENSDLWQDLFQALQSSSVELRRRTALLFGSLMKNAPADSPYFSGISIALRDADSEVRANICRSLNESKNIAAIPILRSLFQDKEPLVRKSALDALGSFPQKEVGAEVFISALKDTDSDIRSFSVEVLEKLGDSSVISHLETLSKKDPDLQIRHLAKKAIAALSGQKP